MYRRVLGAFTCALCGVGACLLPEERNGVITEPEWIFDLSADQAVVSPTSVHLSTDGTVWMTDPGAGLIHRWSGDGIRQPSILLVAGEPLIEPVLISGLSDSTIAVWDRGRDQVLVLNPDNPSEGESYTVSLGAHGISVPRGMGRAVNDLIIWVEVFPEPDLSDGNETILLVGVLKQASGFEQIGQPVPGARIAYSGIGADRRGIYAAGSKLHHIMVTSTDVFLANSEALTLKSLLGSESLILNLEGFAVHEGEVLGSSRRRVSEGALSTAVPDASHDIMQHELRTFLLDSVGRGLYDHAFVDAASSALWFVRPEVDSGGTHLLIRRDATTGQQELVQLGGHGQLRAMAASREVIATIEETQSGRYLLCYSSIPSTTAW